MFEKISRFFSHVLWEDSDSQLSKIRRFSLEQMRVSVLVIRGFYQHECLTRATALTYTTLLSMVPVLTLAFVSFSMYAQEHLELLEEYLVRFFSPISGITPSEAVADKAGGHISLTPSRAQELVRFMLDIVKNIDVKKVGYFGGAFLVFTVVSLIGSVEYSFNKIWGIKKGRSLFRKISSYWTIVTIGPILLVFSIALSGSLAAAAVAKAQGIEMQLLQAGETASLLGWFSALAALLVSQFGWLMTSLMPLCFSMAAFFIFYLYMPNTRVRYVSALRGAFIAALMFELAKPAYSWYAQYLSSSSAVNKAYGALGVFPLFLIWIYLVWLIVLFGAEISYAVQNVKAYQMERLSSIVSYQSKENLALKMMLKVCNRFQLQGGVYTEDEFSEMFSVPKHLIRDIFVGLEEKGFVKLKGDVEKEILLIKSPSIFGPLDIMTSLRENGKEISDARFEESSQLEEFLKSIKAYQIENLSSLTFTDLLIKPDLKEEV